MFLVGKNNLKLLYLEPTTHKTTPMEIIKYFKGYTYINKNELLITEYKNNFEIKQSKKLIKGDKIFLIMENNKIRKFNFDKEAFKQGVCIYQVYNDDTQLFDVFVKGYSYDYVKKNYEEELKKYDIKLEKVGNKAKLLTENITNITELSFNDKNIDYIISFLAGLSFFYGKINIKEDNLVNIKIDVNLSNLWILEEQIYDLKNKLQENDIIVNVSFDNGKLSITSYDYEFENFIKDFYKLDNLKILRYEKTIKKKEELKEYLKNKVDGIENKDKIDVLLENNIKIIES